jgi:hypothetical protein
LRVCGSFFEASYNRLLNAADFFKALLRQAAIRSGVNYFAE